MHLEGREERRDLWSRQTHSACSGNSWARRSCCSVYTWSAWRPSGSACERVGSSGLRRPSRSGHTRTASRLCESACDPVKAKVDWTLSHTHHTCAWGHVWAGAWPWLAWTHTPSHRWDISLPACCPASGVSVCAGSGWKTWRRFCRTHCRCASECSEHCQGLFSASAHQWWRRHRLCNPHSLQHLHWCSHRWFLSWDCQETQSQGLHSHCGYHHREGQGRAPWSHCHSHHHTRQDWCSRWCNQLIWKKENSIRL